MKSLICCAHPGHEVLLHGWLEQALPTVLILTDGSGRCGNPRIEATRLYLTELGLKPGPIFGRFTDRQMYDAILRQDFAFFEKIAGEISDLILNESISLVVGDAAEGYNSVHDICRLLVNSAVKRANRFSSHVVKNLDYPVIDSRAAAASSDDHHITLQLDPQTFSRKIDAAKRFYPELATEVEQALAGTHDNSYREFLAVSGRQLDDRPSDGLETFRTEYLNVVSSDFDYETAIDEAPFYERRGELAMSGGHYEDVIRRLDHMAPIAKALNRYAQAGRQTIVIEGVGKRTVKQDA